MYGQHTKVFLFENAHCEGHYPLHLGSCGANTNPNYMSRLTDQTPHTKWAADYKSFKVVKC